MSASRWTAADVPEQNGRVAVITGSNTGIGYETAAVLADRGARVVMAVRNLDKGKAARGAGSWRPARGADVTRAAAGPDVAGVGARRGRGAARGLPAHRPAGQQRRRDVDPPKQTTEDGFELQFGTNHLGHFALTGLLLDAPAAGARLAGGDGGQPGAHRSSADIHFDDLQWERRYSRIAAYGQSKLANLLFTYELRPPAGRAPKSGPTIAVAAHPGGSYTELARNVPTILHPGLSASSGR